MKAARTLLVIIAMIFAAGPLPGLSVLSHEELIDMAWDSDIRPALLQRFPGATAAELEKAHAYAYGGSIIQDLGYYPLSNHKFTDLVHYVRTGDFVSFMLRDARDLNEFAFALGVLAHYAADNWGHEAINLSVPIEYPKLRAVYGNVVTYEDNHTAHLRTEFSFDVMQVAKKRYSGKQYHDFIGFSVSEELLERAFADTYGVSLDHLLHFDDLTIGTYRFAVSRIIPEITQVAIASRDPAKVAERPDAARKEFVYHISRADYEKEFGSAYRRPGIFARFLAFFLKLIPFGPARVLGYRDPTAQTEDYYFKSMDTVVRQYHALIQQVNAGDLNFPDRNLDTGELTRAGEYALADKTFGDLVRRLAKDHFAHASPALKAQLLSYFAQGRPANLSIKPRDWKKIDAALAELRSTATASAVAGHR